ncbi:MAG: hypothetical protein II384_05785 [Prevotella sp.]|nr:hypothetical protein [Prevotella sp.]
MLAKVRKIFILAGQSLHTLNKSLAQSAFLSAIAPEFLSVNTNRFFEFLASKASLVVPYRFHLRSFKDDGIVRHTLSQLIVRPERAKELPESNAFAHAGRFSLQCYK